VAAPLAVAAAPIPKESATDASVAPTTLDDFVYLVLAGIERIGELDMTSDLHE